MSDWQAGTSKFHGSVSPSDSTTLNFRAIYVGGTGNVVITDLAGNDATYTAVPAGTTIAQSGTKVKAATTATNLVWMR